MRPLVSIVLPTYNRARFLPQAIESICSQQFTDWELIIVDDGSTDETPELLPKLTAAIEQPVQCIRQENQGAYGARNTGLDRAVGKYIAFFDSDDVWLPHHLQHCVEALDANPDIDWVYDACQIVQHSTGTVLARSTFYVDSRPRPFMQLTSRARGDLNVISDPSAACCHIQHGLYCGLQNSVITRKLFESFRFEAKSRNEAEDQLIVVDRLLAGYRFGYIDRVGVHYFVHDENSSAANVSASHERQVRVLRGVAEGFESFLVREDLPADVRRAVRRRLGSEYVWNLGYSTYWNSGRRREAYQFIAKGLSYWPWNWRCWKTYLLCLLRFGFQPPRDTRSGDPVMNQQPLLP